MYSYYRTMSHLLEYMQARSGAFTAKTPASPPFGNLMKPTYMAGNVITPEPRRVVPPPRGIHDLTTPLPKNAYFTEAGIRQWTSHAYTGGNLPVPEGGKAKYDPAKQVLDEQAEERENEFLGRYLTVSEEARNVLQKRFADIHAVRDLEDYQKLIDRGLTDVEAGEVMRRRLVEKVASGKGQDRIDYHQKQKDIIADLALSRRVRVGLPQSMATFSGVVAPDLNFSGKEIEGIKRLLKAKIGQVDTLRKNESQAGQNFNSFPKQADDNWSRNVPTIANVAPPGGASPVVLARTGANLGGTLEELMRRHGGALPPPPLRVDNRSAEEVFAGIPAGVRPTPIPVNASSAAEVFAGSAPGRVLTPSQLAAQAAERRAAAAAAQTGGGRRAALQEVAEAAPFSSSSSVRPAANVAGGGAGGALGGGASAAGGGRGRPAAPIADFERRYAEGSNSGTGASAFLSREVAKINAEAVRERRAPPIDIASIRKPNGSVGKDLTLAAIRAALNSRRGDE